MSGAVPLGSAAPGTGNATPTGRRVAKTHQTVGMEDEEPSVRPPVPPAPASQTLPPASGTEEETHAAPGASDMDTDCETAEERVEMAAFEAENGPDSLYLPEYGKTGPEWTPVVPKGKGKARTAAPQVSPPKPTQTPDPPKRVALKVSPPESESWGG